MTHLGPLGGTCPEPENQMGAGSYDWGHSTAGHNRLMNELSILTVLLKVFEASSFCVWVENIWLESLRKCRSWELGGHSYCFWAMHMMKPWMSYFRELCCVCVSLTKGWGIGTQSDVVPISTGPSPHCSAQGYFASVTAEDYCPRGYI